MHKKLSIIVLFVCVFTTQAQVENDTIDYKYLDDQLYLSFSYNILLNKPEQKDGESTLFSGDFSLGFIKDLPINKKRNIGVGIGVGYNYKSYKNNLEIFNDDPDLGVIEGTLTNRFRTNFVEIPFEFRWRTSSPTKYNFWRVYPGFKVSYLFYSKTKVSYEDTSKIFKNISTLEKWQYGVTLAMGYGTWNIYMYYGLSPLFNDLIIDGTKINIKDFSIGLKFYIL